MGDPARRATQPEAVDSRSLTVRSAGAPECLGLVEATVKSKLGASASHACLGAREQVSNRCRGFAHRMGYHDGIFVLGPEHRRAIAILRRSPGSLDEVSLAVGLNRPNGLAWGRSVGNPHDAYTNL